MLLLQSLQAICKCSSM